MRRCTGHSSNGTATSTHFVIGKPAKRGTHEAVSNKMSWIRFLATGTACKHPSRTCMLTIADTNCVLFIGMAESLSDTCPHDRDMQHRLSCPTSSCPRFVPSVLNVGRQAQGQLATLTCAASCAFPEVCLQNDPRCCILPCHCSVLDARGAAQASVPVDDAIQPNTTAYLCCLCIASFSGSASQEAMAALRLRLCSANLES